ncbi:hypothetical protein COCC4DRAFT_140244 [Bipolaris maydis ATCC 48331]|uniref:Terpene synthase n=1 Tax=Cochliobolus heterostrophus (strain C4 / ATCC 48331 / race T) TaxID=665024 RepID=N4XCQ6_COCH4|nr:uncharacterized protein COCC4DRAFT_140244 [Bipolaris maydis ATCC 48331]ENI04326.1 hypothetical protein COCC4DRAFT_140244 [Bipolaris maydis ATCC 48331]
MGSKSDIATESLASPADKRHLFPVQYSYNYLDSLPEFFRLPNLKLNDAFHEQAACSAPPFLSTNAITISPEAAGLPRWTALNCFRQSKHWNAALAAGIEQLKLFAADDFYGERTRKGQSFRQVSSKLLQNAENGFLRFTLYMFPECNEHKAKLMAIVMVYVFVFDDLWEAHEDTKEGFISHLRTQAPAKTPLQVSIEKTIRDLQSYAARGGQDVIDMLVEFCTHPPPPPAQFINLDEFLAYRRDDAAVRQGYVLACTKFSIGSSVEINSPKLQTLVRLFGNHIVYVNDLGSYEKEKRAYDEGKVEYLINTVHMVEELLSVPGQGKTVTYGLQLQVECDIDAEIGRLKGELTDDEYDFVMACVATLAGNVLCSSIMDRYGGDKAKLS